MFILREYQECVTYFFILHFSEQDRTKDGIEEKIKACEAIEEAAHRRIAEIDRKIAVVNTEFQQKKEEIRHYYASMIEAECSRIDAETRESKRTAKRKRRQGTTLMLVVLPVSWYTGGLVSSWLQGAMNVTIKNVVVNGIIVSEASATVGQTIFIVGTAGGMSGALAAAIQGGDIARGLRDGALFAVVGNRVFNSSVLANSSDMTKSISVAAASSSLHTLLYGGSLPRNLLVGMGAAAGSEGLVPSSANESLGRGVCREAAATTLRVLLSHGSVESLVTNLMVASLGASLGRVVAEKGEQHGNEWHQRRQFKETLSNVSQAASQALATQGVHVPAQTIKARLQQHPALRGSPAAVQQKLIAIGQQREATGAAPRTDEAYLAGGMEGVLSSTLEGLMPVAVPAYSVVDTQTAEPLLKIYDSRVARASTNRQNAFGRGVSQGAEEVSDIMRHPVERFKNVGVLLSSYPRDAHFRHVVNAYMKDGHEQFRQSDPASKVQTVTAVGTVVVGAAAAAAIARFVVWFVHKGSEKINRGIELGRRSNTARKAADEAFRDGKYAGDIDTLRRQTPGSLRRGIKSQKENIYEHEQKLRDPKQACKEKNWDTMRAQEQKNLLYGWRSDIQRAANKIEIAKRILKEKMSQMPQTSNAMPPGVGDICKPVIAAEFSVRHAVKREEDMSAGVEPLSEVVTSKNNPSERGQPRSWCIAPPNTLTFSDGARATLMSPFPYTQGRDPLEQESILEGGSRSASKHSQ